MFQIPTADDLIEFIKDFTGSTNDEEIKKCIFMAELSMRNIELPALRSDPYADENIGVADANGFIPINSIIKDNSITAEMDCYVPPTVGLSFQTNEIMLYTGSVGNYESFLYGIFPMITKDAKYGLNLRLILQL